MAFIPQGSVGQVTDAYRNNPGALQERYGVTKQLVDLMALQRINAEQQAIANQMEMDLGAQANKDGKISDQVALQAFDNTSNNIAQMAGLGGILNARNTQGGAPQAGGPPPPQEGLNQLPAPNMQRMSGGGIVSFAEGAEVVEEVGEEVVGEGGLAGAAGSGGWWDKIKRYPQYSDETGIINESYPDWFQTVRGYLPDQPQNAAWFTNEVLLPQLKAAAQNDPTIRERFNRAFREARDAGHEKFMFDGSEFHTRYIEEMSSGGIVGFATGTEDVIDSERLKNMESNNPYNLRNYDQNWEGENPSTDEFSQFSDLVYGVRAADQTLENYKDLHGIETVREIVERYAPPNENDTETYIEFVSEHLGVSPDEPIDLDNSDVRDSVLTAMGRMESNFEYDRTMLDGTDRERTSEEIVASDVGDDGSTDIVEELTGLQQARGDAATTQETVEDAIQRSMGFPFASPELQQAFTEQRKPLLEERDAAFLRWFGAEQEDAAARKEADRRAEFEAAGIPYPEEEVVEEVISTGPAPDNTLAAVDPEAARNQYEDAMYQRDPRMRAFYEAMGGDEASERLEAEGTGTGTSTSFTPSTSGLNWEDLTDFLSGAQGTTTGSALGAGAQAMTTGRHAREVLDRDEALQYAKLDSEVRQIELRNRNELDKIRATATAKLNQSERDAIDDAWSDHVQSVDYITAMNNITSLEPAQQDIEMANYIMEWYDRQRTSRAAGMTDVSSLLGTTSVVDDGT